MSKVTSFLPSSIADEPVDPHSGSVSSLAPGSTNTLASYTAGADDSFRGMFGTGDSYGLFEVFINGVKEYSGFISPEAPTLHFVLPGPQELADGDVVEITVTNETNTTSSSDFEGGFWIE